MIARDHAPTPRAMRLPIRPWHPCRGWPDVSSGRKEGREMHGGLLWAAFEEWAAHHHSARRSVGLHRHAASEPHRLLLGPVPAAGRPARQRAWPTWPRLKHPEKKPTTTLRSSFDFFLGIAAHGRRCDGEHGTRRHMVVGQRGHRSMVARGLSHRRAALRLVGWPRLRPRSQLPPAFEQLALGLTLPR